MRTWDDLPKVYPYYIQLQQYQHVSFVHSNVAPLIQESSNQGIQRQKWRDTEQEMLNFTVDLAFSI